MAKKCYSYCSMALTCFLLGFKTDAHEFIDKARRLGCFDKTSTRDFIYFNIKSLQQADATLTPKLEEFKKIFQNLDFCNTWNIYLDSIDGL